MKFTVKRAVKQIFIAGIATAVFCLGLILLSHHFIGQKSRDYLFSDVEEVPECEAALVLGTAKFLSGGINPYFQYRIDAAAELYRAGRVKYLIVSGDNSRQDYNEPLEMKNALVEAGVPEHVIYLDYAGFRTLDSVVRMKSIFSQERYIVVSQPFHNERAVFIGRQKGSDVFGFNARDVTGSAGMKTQLREKLARVKVFVDIFIGKQPRFLGEKVLVGEIQSTAIDKQ